MGMDLTVWRRAPLPIPGVEPAWLERDPASGQWFSERIVMIPDECVRAASARIGNIAMLCHLREAVAAPGRTPAILALLSLGGGELIGEGEVRRILGEARGLLAAPSADPEVRTLCTKLIELGEASLREGNPIEVG